MGKGKWSKQKLDCKSRVCVMCEKRKSIDQFYDKKPPYQHKVKQYTIGKMRRCKACHRKMSDAAYHKRTTKEERRIYNRNYCLRYFRTKNMVLPSSYRVNVVA